MKQGKVKWFDNKKGYGFLCNEVGEDVFVHHTVIESRPNQFKTLGPDERVSYEEVREPKGLRATKVVRSSI